MVKDADTIVARATPLGTGGVAIVRLSGPQSLAIADTVFRTVDGRALSAVAPRYLVNGLFGDAGGRLPGEHPAGDESGRVIDSCLAVRFVAPHSFTGEDVVEFHLHGSLLIVDRVAEQCCRLGARPSEPGEFTQRAFLNGKMDLTQVEALADVIATESEQALFVAQRQLHGDLRIQLDELRSRLLRLLALLELELDFVQDGYAFATVEEVSGLIDDLRALVARLLRSYQAGIRLRQGPRVVLLGRPNAGKSSLFNALIGYARALVSPTPGTTRDYVEERVTHGGVQFRLVDTAGLRAASDLIEAEGIERARSVAGLADHVLYLIDGSAGDSLEEEQRAAEMYRREFPVGSVHVVFTKSDLVSLPRREGVWCSIQEPSSVLALLDPLVADYRTALSEAVALVSDRQHHELRRLEEMLSDVRYVSTGDTELLAADLRGLLEPLSRLTGDVASEDVLRTIFSAFCIGK